MPRVLVIEVPIGDRNIDEMCREFRPMLPPSSTVRIETMGFEERLAARTAPSEPQSLTDLHTAQQRAKLAAAIVEPFQ